MVALASPRFVDYSPRSSYLGGTGSIIHRGYLDDLDHNPEVRGDLWTGDPYALGISGRMVRDPHVRKSIEAIVDPLLGATWDFRPASRETIDLEIADFCRYVFFERNSWDRVLVLASNYIRDGFAFLEVIDDYRPIPATRFKALGSDQAIVFTDFADRPAFSISRFFPKESNPTQLAAVEQWLPGNDVEEMGHFTIAADRLLRFSWAQEGANFRGLAPLRSAYGPWKIKTMLLVVDAIRHEREGAGIPRIKLGENADQADRDRAQEILEDIRVNERGYLVLGPNDEFKFETTNGQSTDIGGAIERQNRDIAYNMGVAWMLLGAAGKTGSWALASEQRGQYVLSLEKHARFIENVFNLGTDGWSPVERLVRLNYGPKANIPRLIARNMPTRDWQTSLPVVHNLVLSKVITPDERLEAHVREVLFLPERDPETERTLGTPASAEPALMEPMKSMPDDHDDDVEEKEAA